MATRVTCPACGLSADLPGARGAGPRTLHCPRCGAPVEWPAPSPAAPTAPPAPAGRPWLPVAGWQVAALAAGAALLGTSMATRGFFAAVVNGADLVFHEAGHPVFGLFGSRLLTALGGALGQLFFPAVAAAVFARRREAASFATALLWTGFNVVDIGRYAADGRVRALPLLAPDVDSHDWWNILGILGLRESAEAIGGAIGAAGYALMAFAPSWLAWRFLRAQRRP